MEATLEALIIDDSPTETQTLSYLLRKKLGCAVETAADGLEGLDKLSSRRFDVIFLDLMMPLMNGVEVLREIRNSPDTEDLPVVVISSVSDADTVRQLMDLRIYDYLIKPYNAEIMVKRIGEKISVLRERSLKPVRMGLPGEETLMTDGKEIVLVVDGDANFRHFFNSTLGLKYHVIDAANGAQAIGLALKHLPSVVFAGSKMGVFTRDHMAAKLRQVRELANIRIYAVNADGEAVPSDGSLYNGSVKRSFVPQVFSEAVEKLFAKPPGKAEQRAKENLQQGLVSATEQVFGMMLSCEVVVSNNPPLDPASSVTYGVVDLVSYEEEARLRIVFRCDHAATVAVGMRMLQMDEAEAAQNLDLAQSSLAEVLNIIGGRVKNNLDDQGRTYYLGLPKVEEWQAEKASAAAMPEAPTDFSGGGGLEFCIGFVNEPLTALRLAKADLGPGMVLVQDVAIEGDVPLAKGTRLNADQIQLIGKHGPDEINVFENV